MDWKELQEMATQKWSEMSDLASLHLKLKTSEYRLRVLYEELGKVSFHHFTTEDSRVEQIQKFVEAITVEQKTISDLRQLINRSQEPQSK